MEKYSDLRHYAEQRLHLVACDGISNEDKLLTAHGLQKSLRVASEDLATTRLPLPVQVPAVLSPIP